MNNYFSSFIFSFFPSHPTRHWDYFCKLVIHHLNVSSSMAQQLHYYHTSAIGICRFACSFRSSAAVSSRSHRSTLISSSSSSRWKTHLPFNTYQRASFSSNSETSNYYYSSHQLVMLAERYLSEMQVQIECRDCFSVMRAVRWCYLAMCATQMKNTSLVSSPLFHFKFAL